MIQAALFEVPKEEKIDWPVVSIRGCRGLVRAIAAMMRRGGPITNVRLDKAFTRQDGSVWSWDHRMRELNAMSRVMHGEWVSEGGKALPLKPVYLNRRITPSLSEYIFLRTPQWMNQLIDQYEERRSGHET